MNVREYISMSVCYLLANVTKVACICVGAVANSKLEREREKTHPPYTFAFMDSLSLSLVWSCHKDWVLRNCLAILVFEKAKVIFLWCFFIHIKVVLAGIKNYFLKQEDRNVLMNNYKQSYTHEHAYEHLFFVLISFIVLYPHLTQLVTNELTTV